MTNNYAPNTAAELAAFAYDTAASVCTFCGLPNSALEFVSVEFPSVCAECVELAQLASDTEATSNNYYGE